MTDKPQSTDFEKCNVIKCVAKGTHTVKMLLPPIMPYPQTVGLQIYVGMCLCEAHANSAKPKEFINRDFKDMISSSLINARRVPVDFKRAKLEAIPLSDPGYQTFLAQKKKQEGKIN